MMIAQSGHCRTAPRWLAKLLAAHMPASRVADSPRASRLNSVLYEFRLV
jgi:hypothetical protein